MPGNNDSGPTRGLCTLPELLEALLLILPAGVALVCIETSLAVGLYIEHGEIWPGRGQGTPKGEELHFRPWIPRLSREQYTLVQAMCSPLGAMISAVQVVHMLSAYSDRIASNAVERGWLSEEDLRELRLPDHKAGWDDMLAGLLNEDSAKG
jgi:hypothetical protein